jgi:hypothetical protein
MKTDLLVCIPNLLGHFLSVSQNNVYLRKYLQKLGIVLTDNSEP